MHPSKLGDSYDIVKQSLLQWLAPCGGEWAVHPMFAKNYGQEYPTFNHDFSKFLGIPLLTEDPIPSQMERAAYFKRTTSSCSDRHLFLDPDTGLVPELKNKKKQYLTYKELVEIARKRTEKLIMVFDQSIDRDLLVSGQPKEQMKRKLEWLKKCGVYGVAYHSHANFILVSTDKQMIINAKRTLLEQSRLPENRLIEVLESLD